MNTRPPLQLALAAGLYGLLGLVLVVDWAAEGPAWTSAALYAGLLLIALGVALYSAKPWSRVLGIALTSLLLVVTAVVFVLTATGIGHFSADVEMSGLEFSVSENLVPWIGAVLLAIFGWQAWALLRPRTRAYFRAE